jgi:hypothetical protein
MEPIKNIYQRLNAVMLECSTARKVRVNEHQKYKFVGHDDVTTAIRDSLAKHGVFQRVSISCSVRSDKGVKVDIRVEWVNIDAPTEVVAVLSEGECFNLKDRCDDLQIAKAVSYALKLAQLKNFMLIGDTTPDNEVSHGRPEPDAPKDDEAEEAAVAALTSLESIDHIDGLKEIEQMIMPIASKVSRKTLDLLNSKYEQAEKRLST